MVQAQRARDRQILGLVTAMENTYSFVVSADELKSHPVLQDIMERILKQTIESGYFILQYTQHNFGGTWQVSLNEMSVNYRSSREIYCWSYLQHRWSDSQLLRGIHRSLEGVWFQSFAGYGLGSLTNSVLRRYDGCVSIHLQPFYNVSRFLRST